ncbi:MAG TPA: hypothetical protein VHF89_13710 [Solirubrobacteraceae bacterium]|nr:hypothetical protein [Solirubrobacteraceae bacterium]
MARIDDLQARADALLGTAPTSAEAVTQALDTADPGPPFSPFVPSQLEEAVAVTRQLIATADQVGGEEGLEAALEEARTLAETRPPQLVQHALQLFIVHHPEGSRLSIPPIEPIPEDDRWGAAPADAAETNAERALDYFREDLLANEHHRHWHNVYPGNPPSGQLQDRQGELFFYMHQQMLARYDADRLAVGLEPVEPFADYDAPIGQGYRDRPPDQRLRPIALPDLSLSVDDLEAQRDEVRGAVADEQFGTSDLIAAMDALGTAEEPHTGSVLNGWHHGAGHVLCAWVMHPDGDGNPGLIGSTRTAIRDPFFWRWHRHVDDLGFALQEQFPEHAFDDAPPVDPGELLLAFDDELEAPGGDRLDAAPATTTDELETSMAETPFDPADPQTVPVTHLTHRAFSVLLPIRNASEDGQRVTVRLFLAPEERQDDRRAWIELDKFDARLAAGEETVLHRPTRLASVVRKPTAPEPQFVQPPARTPREQYCRCGWPYHLLLPRGTEDGLPFRLAAIVTDFALDHLHGDSDCGSLSFCGSIDEEFPDRREMGYPFNRPFTSRTIAETLEAEPSMTARTISIRHVVSE